MMNDYSNVLGGYRNVKHDGCVKSPSAALTFTFVVAAYLLLGSP